MQTNKLRDDVYAAMRAKGCVATNDRVVIRQMILPHVFRVDLDGSYFGTWDDCRKTFAD